MVINKFLYGYKIVKFLYGYKIVKFFNLSAHNSDNTGSFYSGNKCLTDRALTR